jgi:hypothetical protein
MQKEDVLDQMVDDGEKEEHDSQGKLLLNILYVFDIVVDQNSVRKLQNIDEKGQD